MGLLSHHPRSSTTFGASRRAFLILTSSCLTTYKAIVLLRGPSVESLDRLPQTEGMWVGSDDGRFGWRRSDATAEDPAIEGSLP